MLPHLFSHQSRLETPISTLSQLDSKSLAVLCILSWWVSSFLTVMKRNLFFFSSPFWRQKHEKVIRMYREVRVVSSKTQSLQELLCTTLLFVFGEILCWPCPFTAFCLPCFCLLPHLFVVSQGPAFFFHITDFTSFQFLLTTARCPPGLLVHIYPHCTQYTCNECIPNGGGPHTYL